MRRQIKKRGSMKKRSNMLSRGRAAHGRESVRGRHHHDLLLHSPYEDDGAFEVGYAKIGIFMLLAFFIVGLGLLGVKSVLTGYASAPLASPTTQAQKNTNTTLAGGDKVQLAGNSFTSLFDAKIDIPFDGAQIRKGKNVEAQVTLYNLLENTAEPTITYFIRDDHGVVLQTSEIKAVKDQASYPVVYQTQYLKSGDYVLGIEVRSGNYHASSTQHISIYEPTDIEFTPKIRELIRPRLGLLLFLSVIIALYVIFAYMLKSFYLPGTR